MNEFWEKQASQKPPFIHSLSNLSNDSDFSKEKNASEKKIIEKILRGLDKIFNSTLEIGAGTCQWTSFLGKISSSVLATDTSKGMLSRGIEYMNNNHSKINNVSYFIGDILEIKTPNNSPYDLIFISGLILYLDEDQLLDLMDFIKINTRKYSYIFLREPVGINQEYIINNIYSEELKTNYSAIYRKEEKFIELFKKINFRIILSEWLHPLGSKFNKWSQTRLKLMMFRRI